jgi:anti-anti-sigma factor
MTSTDYSFTVARRPGGVIVTVHGDLGLAGSIRIGAVLGDLIDGQGNLAVAVDLRQVTSVDSSALGVFTVAARLASRRGGQFSVVGPPQDAAASDFNGAAGVEAHRHLVEFYQTDEALADSVRDYVEPALRHEEQAVVVATTQHRKLFEIALVRAGVDVEGARCAARYVDVDAEGMLSQFMVDGVPDPRRFHASVGRLVAEAARSGRPVRVYGEMVAILWGQDNVAGALALEDLWNDLAGSQRFSLLCAYPTTAFDGAATVGLFRNLCEQHAAVVPDLGT